MFAIGVCSIANDSTYRAAKDGNKPHAVRHPTCFSPGYKLCNTG